MVLESNSMVSESNTYLSSRFMSLYSTTCTGYRVKKQHYWCLKTTVIMLESNGYGVGE
jgi:hypothetical protein